jgi:Ca2+-binding RTX toxin-like protein
VQPSGGYSGEWITGSTWAFQNRPVAGTTDDFPNTPGYGTFGLYSQTALDLGDRNDTDTWSLLRTAVSQFSAQMTGVIPYNAIAPAFNSNSFANTLLWMIGIDTADYIGGASPAEIFDPITGTVYSFSGFPGWGNNALDEEAYSPDFRLTGGDFFDVIRTGYGDALLIGNAGDDELSSAAGNDSAYGGDGNDLIAVAEGDDVAHGGSGSDTLSGGDGADSLAGGAGDDWLYFDAADIFVSGGGGRDVGIVQDTTTVTLDVAASGLGVVLGSTPADGVAGDTFTNITAGRSVGGGGGDDLFVADVNAGTGPVILWGGAGADTFEFTTGGNGGAVGIMVVNVANLTEENFLYFQRSMIRTGGALRWGEIDAIILNPDSADRVVIDGQMQGVSTATMLVYQEYLDEDFEWQFDLLTSRSYLSGNLDPDVGAGQADTHRAGFLGGGTRNVFAAAATPAYASFFQFDDPDTEAAWIESFGPREWEGIFSPGSALAGETDYRYDGVPGTNYFDNIGYLIGWPNGYAGGQSGYAPNGLLVGSATAAGVGTFSTDEAMGPWYVLGGRFDGAMLTGDGSFTATIPPPPDPL